MKILKNPFLYHMKKLIFFWKELLATFWFLPVLIICMAVLFSVITVVVDNALTIPEEEWVRFFFVNNSDSARSILTTISGAMIGVAGTVFSVTLVALTLASSQFGPRLIKNFMYVKLNQVVLGSYIATYLYCLLILNSVKDNDGYVFIPTISILVAILAAVVNIILLIVFIHQIAVSIQADRIISDISDFIAKQLETLFGEKMGEENDNAGNQDFNPSIPDYPINVSIKSPKSGYLQYISSEVLVELVTEHDSILKMHHRPGSYLVKDIEIGELMTHSKWEEENIKKLLDQFVIGKTKTPQQDLEYSIHQMVEIALRALSPGINDPFTAIACIDNLSSTMSYLAQAKFPSKYRYDEENNLRIIAKNLKFEGVLDAAFNQIRQFSAGSAAVIIRLMEALDTIQKFTKTENHKKAVIKHAKMVLFLGEETIKEPNDIEDLKERARLVIK